MPVLDDGPNIPRGPVVPQVGDRKATLTVVAPSSERQPFDNAGVLKPDGPGPLPAGFLSAPDIKKLPWSRRRGEEWTTPAFRAQVMLWLKRLLKEWAHISRWVIEEHASQRRMGTLRLSESQQYLVLRLSRRRDRKSFEVSAPFPYRDAAGVEFVLDLLRTGLAALGADDP